jgi:hypothetical protein
MLVWASAAVAELAAQQQTSDAIPRELVVALLDRYGLSPTPVEIVVGRLPRSVPNDAIPREDIRILGGVEAHGGATVVAEVPDQPESARARVAAHLERAGWRRPEEEERRGGGFVPAGITRPSVFCRANAVIAYTVRERQGATGSRLHLTVSYPDGYSQCTRDVDRRRPSRFDYPSLPTLEAPPGARMLGAGQGGGGPGSREASARLETSQRPADVAEHYAGLLRRAGWTVSPPVEGDGVIVRRTQRQDQDKRHLIGALIVLGIPSTQQLDVVFREARVELPR